MHIILKQKDNKSIKKFEKEICNYNYESIFNKILNLFFPPACGICGKSNNDWICSKCFKSIEDKVKVNIIKTASYAEIENIGDKQEIKKELSENYKDNVYVSEIMYLFKYEGKIREMIIDYKFNEKSYIYITFVKILLKSKKMLENIKNYDTIIPVPISEKRYKKRGYNQSYLLAKEICKYANLNLEENCLYKIKDNVEQSSLSGFERQENIKGAYELKNMQILNNKKILLLDDVYTTGATVNECARILSKAKPRKIGVFILAKD